MRREERELSERRESCRPRIWAQGPHQSKRTAQDLGPSREEKRESCRPRSGPKGPHQSKRTDAERRERVVDPGSGPKVRISPRELMRREERELSTQDLGPRSASVQEKLMRREERELSTQIWAQGPHQSKRTDAREERELSTQDLGPRSESKRFHWFRQKGMCSRGPCISSFSIFTRPVSISSFRSGAALSSSLFVVLELLQLSLESMVLQTMKC